MAYAQFSLCNAHDRYYRHGMRCDVCRRPVYGKLFDLGKLCPYGRALRARASRQTIGGSPFRRNDRDDRIYLSSRALGNGVSFELEYL